ncbi:hypothetical protein CMV_010645 [Castanea mollissima]|uniref:RING-type E3 ubiquitin transferase n=1 Tax=Castanea mollissima TaxID=60419 RepID=A0A8J4VPH0_9ROSI|nr:hypothetical protein CMV_010645 [Castanea mollissima]
MDISLGIVIPSLLLFVVFIVDLGEGYNRCPESRCRADGPAIRFPFRLKDRQPDLHCGYPGFDLYCSHNNDTVLDLNTSVKAFVQSIDYKSRLIRVADPGNCFPWKIPGLNLSSPTFKVKNSQDYFDDVYALFNCTAPEIHEETYFRIDCLSSNSHPVYAFDSDTTVDWYPIVSCTKMYSVSVQFTDDIKFSFLELTWSEPAECGLCEGKGKKCRFKNNSTEKKTECFNPDKGIDLSLPNFHFYNHTSSSRFKPTFIYFIKLIL